MRNNQLEYKGYRGKVKFHPEAKLFHGEVLGIRDVITFQGTNPDEIIQAFQDSIDDYLDWCKERGETPERPYSGKFNLRIPPELHRQLAMEADIHDESLNAFIEQALLFYISRHSTNH
jgi:predicted HicB family RNase H-like nuclease